MERNGDKHKRVSSKFAKMFLGNGLVLGKNKYQFEFAEFNLGRRQERKKRAHPS
jgi:hypothetical protein